MTLRETALSCLCAVALLAGRAEAKCSLTRMATLHVTVENNQILVPGELNGQKVRFVFDTSFPASVVTAPAAKRLGLGVMDYGSLISRFISNDVTQGAAIVPEYRLDGYAVRGSTFAVFGLQDNFGAPDIVGVLGNDYWKQFDVEIDLKGGTIQLLRAEACQDANLAYWGNDYNVIDTFTSRYQTEFISRLNGREMVTILDSGSPFSSLTRQAVLAYGPPLDKEVAADPWRPGIQPTDLLSLTSMTFGLGTSIRPSPDILMAGIEGTPAEAAARRQTLANFGSLMLDEEVIKPARFRIMPSPKRSPETGSRIPSQLFHYDAVLGVDFLLAHHVLIANSQQKLYFSYSGGKALQSVSAKNVQ